MMSLTALILGLILILIGVILILFSSLSGRGKVLSGGIILLGPIPLVFGGKGARAALILAILALALLLFFTASLIR